jgi:hypothetical protein
MTGHDGHRRQTEILAAALMRLLVPAALAVLGVASVWAIGDAVVSSSPVPRDPGFLDSLFASGPVLAAARLAIIAAAAYVVASVAALVARRQWLARVGPVEVSAQVGDLESENELLRDMLMTAQARVDEFDTKLAEEEGGPGGERR